MGSSSAQRAAKPKKYCLCAACGAYSMHTQGTCSACHSVSAIMSVRLRVGPLPCGIFHVESSLGAAVRMVVARGKNLIRIPKHV